jgi:diacylglycerol kinase
MTSNSSSPVVTGWSGRVRCAFNGLGLVLRSQDSARIQAIAALAVVVLGVALRVSAPEWCALVLAIALVLTAEALNTSIESAIDVVSSRVPRARRTREGCGSRRRADRPRSLGRRRVAGVRAAPLAVAAP